MQLQKAIEESKRQKDQGGLMDEETANFLVNFEPLNPDERQRTNAEPVGLKNIGNSKLVFNKF
jgi:hypothetical protein